MKLICATDVAARGIDIKGGALITGIRKDGLSGLWYSVISKLRAESSSDKSERR